MHPAVEWMERRQVLLYLAGLALGAVVGLAVPSVAAPAEATITPVLALLLYATFLGVPFVGIGRAFREWRFLATLFAVNFVLVPPVAWLLSRIVAHDPVLVVGVLLVLLAPCIDYVIVFTGLAGGDVRRLLAATPVLMLAQMALLPVFLWALVGGDTVAVLDPGPFVEAFLLLIVLPLAAAAVTQLISRRAPVGRAWEACVASAMVPLMVATLAVVVASQISAVSDQLGALAGAVSVYVAFAAVLAPAAMVAGRVSGLDVPGRRALVFGGVTRNSLVVLPLALALPAGFELVPLVVVTQTLVELLVMVCLVRAVPVLVR